MKHVVRMMGVAVMVAATAVSASAQTATLKGDVVKSLTDLKATMSKMVGVMPEDKYTFKPTPPQRDFAAQVSHIAQVNVMFGGMVGGKAVAPVLDKAATKKADLIKALDESFDYLIALANEQTDASLVESVPARFIGPCTRARIFAFVNEHTWDTYGQLVVYLRLNGGVPPASVRP